jgi:hypothetical protein
MADLHYFDGQWFNTEEEMQNYLEKRFERYFEEDSEYDNDWMNER